MRFFEQDRIPTTATTTTTSAITTTKPIATLVVVMVAECDVIGTVVVVMTVVMDDDVLVEHIDPDEAKNSQVCSAFEWIQAYPQSIWLKDVAPKNISDIEVTRGMSHSDRSVLKDVA